MANAMHFSKLSRGYVELSKDGSHLEIYADRTERPLVRHSGNNQFPHLSKTFSTKRGPLVLFAETNLRKDSKSKAYLEKRIHENINSPSLITPPPLKFGELKRSILAYGGSPENQFADGIIDADGTFVYMRLPSKKRSHPSKYAGISPHVVMKRRHMLGSGEDKRRDVESILDTDTSASRSQRHSMMKTHVLNDEISLIPPIYRNLDVAPHSTSVSSDAYRFYHVDSGLHLSDANNQEKQQSESGDVLQIVDGKGSLLFYETLEQSEKEKVLADLLIQTALQNIAEQPQIEIFEDALHRVRESELHKTASLIDLPAQVEEHGVPLMTSDGVADSQQALKSQETSFETLPQKYMFGKMQGSRWARHRPVLSNMAPTIAKQSIMEGDQSDHDDEYPNDATQTNSELVHSKIFRASRLLGPIAPHSDHDSLTTRSQQHPFFKSLNKTRRFHDLDTHSHRTTTRIRPNHHDRPNPRLHSSPVDLQKELSKQNLEVNANDHSSTDGFNRQRSSRSLKRHVSRQGTGKTFATDRCVTSPLSIREEAERLLGLETPRIDIDGHLYIPTSTQTTIIEATQGPLIHNTPHSDRSISDAEHDAHGHPSEMIPTENSLMPPEIQMQRSAYTFRSHGTSRSKGSSIVPPGALLIAPDGEILAVGGTGGHPEREFDDAFGHQPSTNSLILDNNDQPAMAAAPYVPMVFGTRRDRLPDETVIRRTMNLTGGDLNSQIDLQSWSYDAPVERRRAALDPYTLIPPAPTMGFSAFTGRKYHFTKRPTQEATDYPAGHSTLSMNTEATPASHSMSHSTQKLRPIAETQSSPFSLTSWAYQRPPTPPMVKRPYLFRPDYRAPGAHGHKHPLGDTETMVRRTINVHAGDIDASLSFTIWVYDLWINDLVKNGADPNYVKQVKSLFDLFKQRRLSKVDLQDKDFLTALANHAQALAKIILKRSDSGYHLAEDAQLAIIENLRNLKELLDQRLASVSDDVYFEILRDTLQHVLTKGNLQHLQVTDEVLMGLMDYPLDAFEIYTDPQTGAESIRIKSAFRTKKNKIKGRTSKKKTKTVIISEEISADDFVKVVDKQTNQAVYRFRPEVAEQKNLMELIEVNFDITTDKTTRERYVHVKNLPDNATFQVEIFIDPDTGKQILVLRKEVAKTPPMVQSDISIDDFELVTDEITGEPVLRLRADVAARKGLLGLAQVNFEVVIDPTTGERVVRMKDNAIHPSGHGRVEIVTDAITGKQTIRMIADDDDDDEESNEPIVTVTENNIDLNDFERVIDPTTGREVLRMRADILKAKGLEELANAEFEIIVDAATGQSRIIMKTPSSDLSGGRNTNFEIVVDYVTGKQKIVKRTTTERESGHVDVLESQLNTDDFERVIDSRTGKEVLRLKKGAAARKGLTDLLDVQFEMVTGADGKQTIVVKGGGNQGNSGKATFELITDASGRTTIKVKKERAPTPDLEVTEKPINLNDFDEVIDPKTGAKVLKLKADVARRAGMTGLLDAQFETYVDVKTGKQSVRVKQGTDAGGTDVKFEIVTDESGKQVLRMVQEIPKTIEVTNSDVNMNDFEEVTDTKTGKKILRMKKEVAKRKGFVDMDHVDFEVVIDKNTGQQIIQIKGDGGKASKGHVTFEMVVDPHTGQQVLRMKQQVDTQFETLENDLETDDFEEGIDEVTGERILKLTAAAATRKGLTDLRDVAFEVYTDPTTGKEQIRMKGGNQTGKLGGDSRFDLFLDPKTGQQKIVLKRPKGRTPPPIEKSIDLDDFEKVVDEKTGKEFYRFTEQAARRKGLTNVQDMEFDIEVDVKTGKTIMKPKTNVINGQQVEVIVDPTTGEQIIRLVAQKPPEKTATIKTTIDLDDNAITVRVDPKTGKQVINLSKDLIESYGLEDVEFEQVIDEDTGQQVLRMKPVIGKDGKVYELITDPTTGKQSLQIKETVTPQQYTAIVQNRETKGLRIPQPVGGPMKMGGYNNEEPDLFQTNAVNRPKKKSIVLSPDGTMTPSPLGNRSPSRGAGSKSRPIRTKSPSGQEYEIEWTSDDEKELDGLSVYEQRKRKEQMLAEKKRKVADMKRQQEFALQQRLKKQQEGSINATEPSSGLLNEEEKETETDLRKLDAEREGLTDDEYQARRKKLFAERTRVLKGAYERKMDRLKRQPGVAGAGRLDGDEAAQLEEELEAQVRAEEDMLLSMMNPEEREEYIRARNEERARARLLAERERVKREEELQAALAETKRMAAIRAGEIMAHELQMRSSNSLYAELTDLITEQKISRAFTYSYFSLLQFLSSNSTD